MSVCDADGHRAGSRRMTALGALGAPQPSHRRPSITAGGAARAAAVLVTLVALHGCALVAVAGAAVAVGAEVVSTSAKVTGKVVGKAIDVVMP